MRKLLSVSLAGLMLVGVCGSHLMSAPPATKVLLCHRTSATTGHFINVAAPAVKAHLAHGDCRPRTVTTSKAGIACDPTDLTGSATNGPDGICDNI